MRYLLQIFCLQETGVLRPRPDGIQDIPRGERAPDILTYLVETVLAEKIETAITRGVLNTRMKDYYDICMLLVHQDEIEEKLSPTRSSPPMESAGVPLMQESSKA